MRWVPAPVVQSSEPISVGIFTSQLVLFWEDVNRCNLLISVTDSASQIFKIMMAHGA